MPRESTRKPAKHQGRKRVAENADDGVRYSAKTNQMSPEKDPLNLQLGRFFLSMCRELVGLETLLLWVKRERGKNGG